MNESQAPTIQYLGRPDGRIAYTVTGPDEAPLIVAFPGMGDLRDTWRDVAGPLADVGFRVALADLRGHGDSDTTFRDFSDGAIAGDMLALIDELGGPALILGNSIAGSAAIIAAAERPDAVAGLALVSPFGRERLSPFAIRAMGVVYRVLFARPWGVAMWASYYAGTLNKGAKSSWLAEHVAELRAAMRKPGHLRSFRDLSVQLDHSVVEPRLASVTAPTLIAIGELDPDFKNPAAELAWLGEQLHAETLLVENAAHYAQHQRPDVLVPRVVAFAENLRAGAATGGWKARA